MVLWVALFLATTSSADVGSRRTPIVQVVEKVGPAVVHIATEQIVARRSANPFFDEFFGRRSHKTQGLGTGVIIDATGLIVTNDHVIRGASTIEVVLADGRELEAEVLGSDADNDLAVLRVPTKSRLPVAKLGTSSDLMIGETVIAIGSPFGLDKSVTSGLVSATGRSFKADGKVYNDFVQTDASINPGNSGGPLLNLDGDIIGINTAIFNGAQGIGFAIPADKVRRIVGELTQFGKVRPAWVGIEVAPLTPALARRVGWDRNYGAVVTEIDKGSPAERAGVRVGDVISEVSGTRVLDAEDFEVRMRGYPAKASVRFSLFRDGRNVEVTFEPVEFPPSLAESMAWERLGLRVGATDGRLIVKQVRPRSVSDQAGLRPGDGILRVNNVRITDMAAFREALIAARGSASVLLLVQRGRYVLHGTLPF